MYNELRLDISVENGKYTIQQNNRGELYALRYGKPWRDCAGDNLIYSLASHIEELRESLDFMVTNQDQPNDLENRVGFITATELVNIYRNNT